MIIRPSVGWEDSGCGVVTALWVSRTVVTVVVTVVVVVVAVVEVVVRGVVLGDTRCLSVRSVVVCSVMSRCSSLGSAGVVVIIPLAFILLFISPFILPLTI